jgi:hypothetical protein
MLWMWGPLNEVLRRKASLLQRPLLRQSPTTPTNRPEVTEVMMPALMCAKPLRHHKASLHRRPLLSHSPTNRAASIEVMMPATPQPQQV